MSTEQHSTIRRLVQRVALVFVGLLLAALCGEAMVRIILRVKGTPYSATGTRDRLEELNSQLTASIPMPRGLLGSAQE